MSIGSILVAVAVALVVGAYLARPFRRGRVNLDQAIETWISRVKMDNTGGDSAASVAASAVQDAAAGSAEDAVNYCSQCGRRVRADDRFCARCGRPLPRGER